MVHGGRGGWTDRTGADPGSFADGSGASPEKGGTPVAASLARISTSGRRRLRPPIAGHFDTPTVPYRAADPRVAASPMCCSKALDNAHPAAPVVPQELAPHREAQP